MPEVRPDNTSRFIHKYLVYGWLEKLDTVPQLAPGKFWGIPVSATPILRASPIPFLGLSALLNFRVPPFTSLEVNYFAPVYLADVGHSLWFYLSASLASTNLFSALTVSPRYPLWMGHLA